MIFKNNPIIPKGISKLCSLLLLSSLVLSKVSWEKETYKTLISKEKGLIHRLCKIHTQKGFIVIINYELRHCGKRLFFLTSSMPLRISLGDHVCPFVGLSVRPSLRTSVRPSLRTSVRPSNRPPLFSINEYGCFWS